MPHDDHDHDPASGPAPDKTDNISANKPVNHWWWARRAELVALAPEAEPVYVYDSATILNQVKKLKTKLTSLKRLFYAMKANSHPKLLSLLFAEGLSFETVSRQEMELVFSLFPTIESSRILFTPNFAHRSEYEFALQRGIHVTVDNLYCLQHWPDLFKGHEILLRIDPGTGHGHHAHVKTGGSDSKFGITQASLPEIVQICEANNITVVGLHCHSGSGIGNTQMWAQHATLLADLARKHFPHAKYLDLGGGLGHPYHLNEKEVNLDEVGASLKDGSWSQYELWMEPGRYIIAGACVILGRVTQIKKKDTWTYVGTTAGMNSLIRPALYQAHHAIVNLSRADDTGPTMTSAVCGPICESGDVMGRGREFPQTTAEDDVVLIDSAGAYGRCMASFYNVRNPGDEIFI